MRLCTSGSPDFLALFLLVIVSLAVYIYRTHSIHLCRHVSGTQMLVEEVTGRFKLTLQTCIFTSISHIKDTLLICYLAAITGLPNTCANIQFLDKYLPINTFI